MLTPNRHNMSVNHLLIITCSVVLSSLEHINNFELSFFLALVICTNIQSKQIIAIISNMILLLVFFGRDITLFANIQWLGDRGCEASHLFNRNPLFLINPNCTCHRILKAFLLYGSFNNTPNRIIHNILNIFFF